MVCLYSVYNNNNNNNNFINSFKTCQMNTLVVIKK